MILVLNAGSSSLKFQILDLEQNTVPVRGLVERVGSSAAPFTLNGQKSTLKAPDLKTAFAAIAQYLPLEHIVAVGHRIVHGGERFLKSTLLTTEVLEALEKLSPLAPLHNPANLEGVRAALELLPTLPMVAVFDTAFHATLPPKAYLYALPHAFYTEQHIRRYGFHGPSHQYVSQQAAHHLERPITQLKLVTLHLGNGASACAVLHGKSVDTSMGFTPLEGLMMGSRSGDLDPSVVLQLAKRFGLEETSDLLNKKSGLLGLSGVSNDLRDVHSSASAGNEWAEKALEVMAYRIGKIIGAYAAAMGGLDALVFTGGAGENDADLRARALENLEFLGLELDAERNTTRGTVEISTAHSRAKILVIPTDEERMIALETVRVLEHFSLPLRHLRSAPLAPFS